MDRLFALPLYFLLIAIAQGSHAALSPELYWKSVLPNTPMPSSLSKLLDSAGQGKLGGTGVHVGKGGVGFHVKPRRPSTAYVYHHAAEKTQMYDDPNVALFFLEKDLHPGTKMTIQFTTTMDGAKFLPRSEAEAIPFSSKKVPEILSHFKVMPDSAEATEITQTLHRCEEPAATGEKKTCATSLESMVDFATSSLGTNHVKAVSTITGKVGTPRQEYTMTSVRQMTGVDQLVPCHAEPYVYPVFQCHLTQARAYTVSLVGKDGTATEAAAVCHTDTAGWNPRHVAFQVLKVKPGTVSVCHFVPEDHVIWTRTG